MPAFLQPFFLSSFWFGGAPAVTGGTGRFVLAFFAACVLAGVILRVIVLRRVAERHLALLVRRLARLLTTMGIVGLVLGFFSYENASFFGDRFWYGLWLVGTLVWAGWLAWYGVKELPRLRATEIAKREKQKYLP
jgi:hypothetical protein